MVQTSFSFFNLFMAYIDLKERQKIGRLPIGSEERNGSGIYY